MKQETYYLTSLEALKKVSSRLFEIIPNGKVKVTFADAGSKTLKQNNLWFLWCTDVSRSGIGGEHEDHVDGVHLVGKYLFVVPILQRDDDFFAELYAAWYKAHQYDKERIEYFVAHHVSTTVLNKSQMAEALTAFKNHYGVKHRVNLREPEFQGLLDIA